MLITILLIGGSAVKVKVVTKYLFMDIKLNTSEIRLLGSNTNSVNFIA